ncbi:hypothetical protein [Candidatus Nitrospira bockiana]
MVKATGHRRSERQLEPGTRFICEQCRTEFQPKNRNGVKARFCKDACRTAWKNGQRLQGAALLKKKAKGAKPRRSNAPVFDRRVSQTIALNLIPAAERPALLAQAAERLGLTESPVLQAARAARRICDQTIAQGRPSPFKSPDEIRVMIEQTTDPERRLKLEAMLGVIEARTAAA